MTDLTRADRFFRWQARNIERRTLHLVASQPLLRRIFALSAPLGASIPKDMPPKEDANGALWFTPPEAGSDAPLLMYVHGGGFTIGGPRTHAALVAHLARAAGMRAVAIRYRLAPEHPFPAARDDAIAAYDRLVAAGTPPAALCGDSAGGCLALQVAQHARDSGTVQPKALGLIAPIADLSGDIASRFDTAEDEILIPPAWPRRLLTSYLAGIDPTDPAVSPLLGDLSNLPPTMIQAATGEALAQDAKRLETAMNDVTLDLWPGLAHVWHLHAGYSRVANDALQRLGAFLRNTIG
ncbi:alpha/beta hydrolase [Marivita geojedonensis]|uniref:alpha/beta hydrolase n=1 Tax=Marivita geojedonensis TaxID=1123756 RepID=UPI000A1DEF65|nr:alpha/beta hydrolase [Marivita geojedonensis]PRY76448.1 acetyl esterase/lipase [Marivita geojedonensis]